METGGKYPLQYKSENEFGTSADFETNICPNPSLATLLTLIDHSNQIFFKRFYKFWDIPPLCNNKPAWRWRV